MKHWIAVAACLMVAASAPALAQDKAKADEKKAAPAATAPKADEKKAAPAASAPKADEKKAESAKTAPRADEKKKQPTEKQKAQQDKMKACSKEASDKKLKGDERKKFMSTCMKG